MNGNIEETIEGMKVIKVFNHEEQAISEFTETNENFRKAATNANFFAGIMGPCSTGINNASYATIALVGGILALGGNLDIGTFFTFLSYSKQFTQPINQIANQMNTVFSALAGAERVFEIMDMKSEVDDGTVTLEETEESGERKLFWNDGGVKIPVEGNVVFENVDFSYVPEKPVLKDISLYAKHGQKIAFVGSTGAGKTTITNLINRFYDIQNGIITYDGIDIKRIKKDDLRRTLSIVLQDTHLFTGTVMSAVAKPVVLILDEATSSVDTRTELHIEHGMDRLMTGRTVFVIAHRLSTVRNSNAIMVLENGEITERGDHEDLLRLGGRYYQLCTGKAQLT